MKPKQRMIMATLALFMLACLSTTAQADPVTFTLNNPNQSGTPGSVLTFTGNFSNLGQPQVMITGNDSSFIPSGGLTVSDSPFVGQTVNPMGSISGTVFTVMIGLGVTPGSIFNGQYTLQFNGLTSGQDVFQPFSVTVLQGPEPIPEPATMVLLGTGLAAGAAVARSRKRRRA